MAIQNPFQLFQLEPAIYIDRQLLDRAFQKLQKAVHPDQHHDPLHKMAAQKLSADISYYYHTMLSPIGCINLILHILGLAPVEQLAQQMSSPNWATYAFDIQEQLMSYTHPQDKEKIDACLQDIKYHIGEQEKFFIDAFKGQNKEDTAHAAINLAYLLKLHQNAEMFSGHKK